MKKLILVAAFAFGTLTAVQAQTVDQDAQKDKQMAMKQEVVKGAPVMQDGFAEIQTSALPTPVTSALSADFEGATVAKAYKNDKGAYKLSIITAEKKTKTVYANSNGEWIKPQKGGA